MSELVCIRARCYTFVYERDCNRLVALFGKKLALHVLDPINPPGVVLNRYGEANFKPFGSRKSERTLNKQLPNSIPSPVSNVSPLSQISPDSMVLPPAGTTAMPTSMLRATSIANSPCAKGEQRFVELAIAYDTTFCESFGYNDEKIAPLVTNAVRDAEKIFKNNTCIRLRIVYDDKTCEVDPGHRMWRDREKSLTKPLKLTTCSSNDCEQASVILGHLRTFGMMCILLLIHGTTHFSSFLAFTMVWMRSARRF